MRYIWVHILFPEGHTAWRMIPWGKKFLDEIRKEGGTILGHHE